MGEAEKIYDALEESAKDMPRAEFIKRFNAVNDQETMQQDLARIVNGKRERKIIDRAVNGQN